MEQTALQNCSNKFFNFSLSRLKALVLICLFAFACVIQLNAQTSSYNYNGSVQYYTVPNGVHYLSFSAAGAQGGYGTYLGNPAYGIPPGANFGKGQIITGTLKVNPGDILSITCGGAGSSASGGAPGVGAGGYNGGGAGYGSGGGGGCTIIEGSSKYNSNNYTTAFVVAGGGGGGYQGTDASGVSYGTNQDYNNIGYGANANTSSPLYVGGGGGAGYSGGGAGNISGNDNGGGGTGGTGFVISAIVRNVGSSSNQTGNGTVSFTPLRIPPGNALNFDGNTTYVSASLPLTNINNFTAEAWVMPSVLNANQGLFSYGSDNGSTGNGINLYINNTGALVLNLPGQSGYPTGFNFPLSNKWYHIALTRNNGNNNVYVDGKLVFTDTHTPITPTEFVLGAHSGARYFNGNIDEFRFYNTALTAAQILSDAYDTTISLPANLLAYYNFDIGYASSSNSGLVTLTDRSSNAYNGTLHNFALSGITSNWVESYAMVVPLLAGPSSVTQSTFSINWVTPKIGLADYYVADVSTKADFSAPITGSPITVYSNTPIPLANLLPNTTYYYRVRSGVYSLAISGGCNNFDSVTTTAPAQPTITGISPNKTYIGDSIFIIGTNFNNVNITNNIVLFGAAQAMEFLPLSGEKIYEVLLIFNYATI